MIKVRELSSGLGLENMPSDPKCARAGVALEVRSRIYFQFHSIDVASPRLIRRSINEVAHGKVQHPRKEY